MRHVVFLVLCGALPLEVQLENETTVLQDLAEAPAADFGAGVTLVRPGIPEGSALVFLVEVSVHFELVTVPVTVGCSRL